MRRVMIGLGLLGLAQSAHAADLPYLRGSNVPTYHWGGFYAGAQVGYSGASYDFSNGVSSLVSFLLSNAAPASDVSSANFGRATTNGFAYGAFVGYNAEWEGVIVGVELNYNRSSLFKSASGSAVSPVQFQAFPLLTNATVTGTTSRKITDMATLRGRAGWEAGPFLPYAFAGVAVARADVTQSASVTLCDANGINCAPPGPLPPGVLTPVSTTESGKFVYGGAAGLGLDMLLVTNVFARLEWEYLLLQPIDGIHANVNSVRAAVGFFF